MRALVRQKILFSGADGETLGNQTHGRLELGLVVLEMFPAGKALERRHGRRLWLQTATANSQNLKFRRPGLDDLLGRCFQNNEADRPMTFSDIEMELLVIYEMTTGR